jgi:hypothetical protein
MTHEGDVLGVSHVTPPPKEWKSPRTLGEKNNLLPGDGVFTFVRLLLNCADISAFADLIFAVPINMSCLTIAGHFFPCRA